MYNLFIIINSTVSSHATSGTISSALCVLHGIITLKKMTF